MAGRSDSMTDSLQLAGWRLRTARRAEQVAMKAARLAATAAWEAGTPETEIAHELGVDRMTIRKWRGKR